MSTKVATRSSIEQVAIIDAMLARPEGASVGELMQRLDCCERTVRRHMSWMKRTFELRLVAVGWGTGRDRRWVYPVGQSRIFNPAAARRLS
jgi:predicted ArsR family transcriptional regulator